MSANRGSRFTNEEARADSPDGDAGKRPAVATIEEQRKALAEAIGRFVLNCWRRADRPDGLAHPCKDSEVRS